MVLCCDVRCLMSLWLFCGPSRNELWTTVLELVTCTFPPLSVLLTLYDSYPITVFCDEPHHPVLISHKSYYSSPVFFSLCLHRIHRLSSYSLVFYPVLPGFTAPITHLSSVSLSFASPISFITQVLTPFPSPSSCFTKLRSRPSLVSPPPSLCSLLDYPISFHPFPCSLSLLHSPPHSSSLSLAIPFLSNPLSSLIVCPVMARPSLRSRPH